MKEPCYDLDGIKVVGLNYMDYLQRSQEIKKEILNTPNLMEALIGHLNGTKEGTHLGKGTFHKHFRIGQLESGLWLATRESLFYGGRYCNRKTSWPLLNFNQCFENFEEYCQAAEKYYKHSNYITTSFCIGLKYKGDDNYGKRIDKAAILLEDLTRGGTLKLGEGGRDSYIDGEKRVVLFDLSYDSILGKNKRKIKSNRINGIKYFTSENMIDLTK